MLSDTAAGRATVLGLKAARSGDTDPKHAAESTLQSLDLVRWRQPRTCRRVLPPEKLMHNYRTNLIYCYSQVHSLVSKNSFYSLASEHHRSQQTSESDFTQQSRKKQSHHFKGNFLFIYWQII